MVKIPMVVLGVLLTSSEVVLLYLPTP
ncbi:uncharacterized protein METZ01_LOCUS165317, partial [marine metagenome]